MIDGVIVQDLKQISDERGKVMHMLRCDSPLFEKFGEMHLSVPIVIAGADLSISSSSSNKDGQNLKISSGVTCDSTNSWLMTPFSSGGEAFNIGFVIKKND